MFRFYQSALSVKKYVILSNCRFLASEILGFSSHHISQHLLIMKHGIYFCFFLFSIPPQLSIFNCIKFYETPRTLEIYDAEWNPVTTAHLGSNLPKNSIPEDCTHYLHYLRKHNYSLPNINLDDEDYE